MRRIVASALVVVFLSGCAKVHMVDLSSEDAVADLNAALSGKTVLLRTADGYEIKAEQVEVTPESTQFLNAKWKIRTREIPTRSIQSIVDQQKWGLVGGAVRGLAFGAVAGGLIGFNQEDPIFSNGTMAVMGAAFGGLLGIVGGVLLGTGVGSDQVYELGEGQ